MNAEIKWQRGFRVGRFIVRLNQVGPQGAHSEPGRAVSAVHYTESGLRNDP